MFKRGIARAWGGRGVWGARVGARGAAVDVRLPGTCWSTLPNSVRVVSETTASPLAAVGLYIEAGSRYETRCNNGATHFYEHMALKGFGCMTRAKFENCLQSLGIKFDVHTDREYQAFTATCTFDRVELVLTYLAGIISCPNLTKADILASKETIRKELEDADVDYKRVTLDYLHDTAFQGSTLARAPIGPWQNYVSFDADFVQQFICQQFQPFRLIVSISSVFCHDDILCMVQKQFGCIPHTTNKLVDWPSRYTGSILRYRNDDLRYIYMAIAFECGGYFSSSYHTLQLMKHMVGSYNESQKQGEVAWPILAQATAICKMCVSYEAFYIPYRDVGLFGVYSVTNKEVEQEDFIYMLQNTYMNMCVNVAPADVERALNCYMMELANNCRGALSSVRDMALQIMFWGKRYTYFEQAATACAITNLHVQALSDVVLHDRCPAVAGVGPTESIPEYNRLRQGQYWLRL